MTEDAFDSPETVSKLRRFFARCVSRREYAERTPQRQSQLVHRLVEHTLAAAALRTCVLRDEQRSAGDDPSEWRNALSIEALTRCHKLR